MFFTQSCSSIFTVNKTNISYTEMTPSINYSLRGLWNLHLMIHTGILLPKKELLGKLGMRYQKMAIMTIDEQCITRIRKPLTLHKLCAPSNTIQDPA